METGKDIYDTDEVIKVTFQLENTGNYTAEEVVQLYVHRPDPKVEWPEKELKAFKRVSLDPGKSTKVTLEIPAEALRYWNETTDEWVSDPGKIEFLLGTSSRDIKLRKTISIRS
jgi:beta-glucosidase